MKQSDTILLGAFIGVCAAGFYAFSRTKTKQYTDGEMFNISNKSNPIINICSYSNGKFYLVHTYDFKNGKHEGYLYDDRPIYNIKYGDQVEVINIDISVVRPNEFYYVERQKDGLEYVCKATERGGEDTMGNPFTIMTVFYQYEDNNTLGPCRMRKFELDSSDNIWPLGHIRSLNEPPVFTEGGKRKTRKTRRRRR